MAFAASSQPVLLAQDSDDLREGRRRRRLFVCTTVLVLIVGTLFTLTRDAVYESRATVLMSAETPIDQPMLEADVQGVAIQQRALTGAEITAALSQRIAAQLGTTLSRRELRELLSIEAVPGTNLLELRTRGADATALPLILENWIRVYTEVRAADIERQKSRTIAEIDTELGGLSRAVEEARAALEVFRAENQIISMEREQNAVMARLDGLNASLNNAVEEEVRAKAYLETLRASLAAGDLIVPENERSEVATMAEQLAELRAQLTELRVQYTDSYIARDARLREIPLQIEALEAELRAALDEGSRLELATAERAYIAARESVRALEDRLAEHKDAVAAFNSVYARHEALVEDLARLEELNRETQARQVQVQVRQVENYPQVTVIEWPGASAERIGPPLLNYLGITLAAALLGGIFVVWLYGFLNPRKAPATLVAVGDVTGLSLRSSSPALDDGREEKAALDRDRAARLASDATEEPERDDSA